MIRRILYLYRFTRSEQLSIIVLFVLIILINIAGFFIRQDRILPIEAYPRDNSDLVESSGYSSLNNDHQPISGKDVSREKKLIEINTADSISLLSLYGIGPSFSRRIIKYRGLLGGYFKKDQLLEVYGMDSARFNGFSSDISVDKSKITTIDINTAGFRELLRHPYLDYEQVKKIVNFRDRHGPFQSLSVLWTDSVLIPEMKNRIGPYLVAGQK